MKPRNRQIAHPARSRMAREAPGQTLQATALVHEAYLQTELTQGREEK